MSNYKIPMELNEHEQKIVNEAHAERDAWNRREERREVYLMVAGRFVEVALSEDLTPDNVVQLADGYAEAIYQGMLKFCGNQNKNSSEEG